MRIKPQQILVAIGSMVITLGIFFGIQGLLQQRMVNDPLDQFYKHAPGVRSFTVTNQGGVTVIHISLKKVADLEGAYVSLENKTAALLPSGTFRLVLQDRRSGALTAAYNRMALAIQQAMATGQFMDMEGILTAEGKSLGLSGVNVQVDDFNVYLQLAQGNSYLYAIISRHPSAAQGVLLGGGG